MVRQTEAEKARFQKGNKAQKREIKEEKESKKSEEGYLKKEAKLKRGGDKRKNCSSEIQRKLKTRSRETQDGWNFAKISVERKHQRFKKEAPQKM